MAEIRDVICPRVGQTMAFVFQESLSFPVFLPLSLPPSSSLPEWEQKQARRRANNELSLRVDFDMSRSLVRKQQPKL